MVSGMPRRRSRTEFLTRLNHRPKPNPRRIRVAGLPPDRSDWWIAGGGLDESQLVVTSIGRPEDEGALTFAPHDPPVDCQRPRLAILRGAEESRLQCVCNPRASRKDEANDPSGHRGSLACPWEMPPLMLPTPPCLFEAPQDAA